VIGLVACAKTKLDRPAPARELYTSPLFRGSLAYAEQRCDRVFILSAKHGLVSPDEVIAPCDRVFILSAKHGLVSPDEVIAPYDETVKRMAQRERQFWAARVLAALQPLLSVDTPILALASGDYLNPIIQAHLATGEGELYLRQPLQGMQIGQRLAFLKQSLATKEAA
jgi:cytoplasmic iron level regulating protein YaaA (DUF328/UPF0246 family)